MTLSRTLLAVMLLWKRKKFALFIKILGEKTIRKLWRDPVCTISILKISLTKTGQTIKNNVTFAQTFWRKQKLITLTIQISKLLLTRGSGPLWNCFNNIDIRNITDNKRFWTAVKPFFTDKSKTCNNIILNENDKTIKDGKEIASKFNKFLANIKKLNLNKDTRTSFESMLKKENSLLKVTSATKQ